MRMMIVLGGLVTLLVVIWQFSALGYLLKEPIFEQNEHVGNLEYAQAVPVSGEFRITWPDKINRCHRAEIIFESKHPQQTMWPFLSAFYVQAECSSEDRATTFSRILPIIPHPTLQNAMVAYVLPDDFTWQCRFQAVHGERSEIKFTGATERGYQVVPGISFDELHCNAHFPKPVPLATDFLLLNEHGQYLGSDLLTIDSGSELDLWVKLHPLLLPHYPEAVKHLQFNAYLQSFAIIANVKVGSEYHPGKGYRLQVTGRDSGKFSLVVTLNWVYGDSEVRTEDPTPILLSSHGRHYVSQLDLARSQIPTAERIHIQVLPLPGQSSVLLRPEHHTQCTSANVEGRWLNVLPVGEACMPPYCTGDRTETLIDTASWQGEQYPWVWVPYSCHYHLYSPQDIQKCSDAANIRWIHFMGDSLTRNILSYFMSMCGRALPDKFESFDNYVDVLGLRLSYSNWPKDFVEYPLHPARVKTGGLDLLSKLSKWNLPNPGEDQVHPNIFFVNGANAEALRVQTEEQHQLWVRDFAMTMWSGFKYTRTFWHGNPYFHGQGHDNNDYVTQSRNERFLEIAHMWGSPDQWKALMDCTGGQGNKVMCTLCKPKCG